MHNSTCYKAILLFGSNSFELYEICIAKLHICKMEAKMAFNGKQQYFNLVDIVEKSFSFNVYCGFWIDDLFFIFIIFLNSFVDFFVLGEQISLTGKNDIILTMLRQAAFLHGYFHI